MVKEMARLLRQRKTRQLVRHLILQLDNAESLLEVDNEEELVAFIMARVATIERYGLSKEEILDLMLEELNYPEDEQWK